MGLKLIEKKISVQRNADGDSKRFVGVVVNVLIGQVAVVL